MAEPLKQTNIRLPEELWKNWKIRAITEGITMSELLEKALARYLEPAEASSPATVDSIHPVRRDR